MESTNPLNPFEVCGRYLEEAEGFNNSCLFFVNSSFQSLQSARCSLSGHRGKTSARKVLDFFSKRRFVGVGFSAGLRGR